VPFSVITTKTIEMQAKSLENSITKPPLFTSAPCIRPSQIALKSGALIPPNFAVPFKIYSIRDFSSAVTLTQPSIPQAIIQTKTSPKDTKVNEKETKVDCF
jgi:hypothetical protein